MYGIAENYVIGMDCGTTNIKAILLSDDGTVVAEESRRNKTINRGGGALEQDSEEWWANAVSIFRGLTEKAGEERCRKIRGIAISSHTVTMLPLDGNRRPLRNALTCQDGRSAKEMHRIVRTMGLEHFVSTVGGQPAVAFLPNKIEWFRRHEPELFARTRYYIQASSYINMKLTGVMVTDIDQATRTQCWDINTMDWSHEIGNIIGVDFHEAMPPVKEVDDIIGTVTGEAAKITGLPVGIAVTAGSSDALASMYAMGMNRLGDAGESCGTTSLVFAGSASKSPSDIPVVTRPCRIEGMPWIFDAPIQSSGSSIQWFIDHMAGEEQMVAKQHGVDIHSYLNGQALKAAPGAAGVFFYPYLMGERAPIWNEYARGMFLGLGMDTTRNDLIRSIYEGTAYALRSVIETIKASGAEIDSLRICGGGARSRTWCQIKSSMLRIPVLLLDERSGDVPLGDALLVGHKTGVFPDLVQASERIIRVKETIWPIEEWAQIYDRLFPVYTEMYHNLEDSMKIHWEAIQDIYSDKIKKNGE
ncbi:MAG: xylulokinase [Lachnospiraceae bacterium]